MLKKVLLSCLIIAFITFSFAQEIPETTVGKGQQEQEIPELRILAIVSALNEKVSNSVTVSQINENFAQLDNRIQSIQFQLLSFVVITVLVNDVLIVSLYFVLKGRGIL